MDCRNLSEADLKFWSENIFEHLSSAEDIKNWVYTFLDLELPLEITDPESTSSPLDAIWQVYNTFKNNSGDVNPGYILMSCREGMKTVSVSILEILLLIHFQLDIGHAAAIESQSSVALGYINGFIMSIEPLLKRAGWVPTSENKRLIKYSTPQGKQPFIKIVICNPKGMNSLHSNVLFLDELDLADPRALKEGKFITGYSKGIYGVKVYLSTRKYAFGNMAKAIEDAPKMNFKILRWNILDVTERCPSTRHQPDGILEDRYVAKNLPLIQISPQEFELMPESDKLKYDLLKDTYEGCRKCTLLPICRMRLANKPEAASGGFYKPITSIKQAFTESDADAAEAQLLCWKPGTEGMVYPRFNSTTGAKGNVLTLKMAYEKLTGGPTNKPFITEMDLLEELKKLNIPMYAGVDWGHAHDSVITIVAKLPTQEIWVLDCFAVPGLEFSDVLLAAISYRDKYNIQKWFCDGAQPANVKSFNRNGMKSPKFIKDVMGGIEAVRSKITNASGARLFKVIDTPNTRKVVSAIIKHRFLLDGQGNVTTEPDDTRGVADICDTLRYIGQNLFPVRGDQKPEVSWTDIKDANARPENPTVNEQMKDEIAKRIADDGVFKGGTKKKGGLNWNI
jgi:hypothetical protein